MAVERLCPPVACNITVSRKKTEAGKIACDLSGSIGDAVHSIGQ